MNRTGQDSSGEVSWCLIVAGNARNVGNAAGSALNHQEKWSSYFVVAVRRLCVTLICAAVRHRACAARTLTLRVR